MYERAYLVRPLEDVEPEPMGEEVHQDLDQDEDPPFDMSQIKTSGMKEEPGCEWVYCVRARLEQEKKADKSGLTKSEQIKPDIVTSFAIAEPKVLQTAERKKAKRVERAMAILSTDDYHVARFGIILGNSACILWLADRTMFTPKGIQYFPVENEYDLPLDMPIPEPDEKPVIPEYRQ